MFIVQSTLGWQPSIVIPNLNLICFEAVKKEYQTKHFAKLYNILLIIKVRKMKWYYKAQLKKMIDIIRPNWQKMLLDDT